MILFEIEGQKLSGKERENVHGNLETARPVVLDYPDQIRTEIHLLEEFRCTHLDFASMPIYYGFADFSGKFHHICCEQESTRRYEPTDRYRPYPAPPIDLRSREPRGYSSGINTGIPASSASFRSGGPIRSAEAVVARATSNVPKADLRDLDLQEVILSSRPGARRDRPLPVSRGPGPRVSGPPPRSRASQALLDAAMDDYWNQDDDGAAAPPVCYCFLPS